MVTAESPLADNYCIYQKRGAAVLTMSDRCDRCGAQAFVAALFSTSELLFCAHHARLYRDTLVEQAIEVWDGTHMINEKPSISANAD